MHYLLTSRSGHSASRHSQAFSRFLSVFGKDLARQTTTDVAVPEILPHDSCQQAGD